jgi:diguanylate cyclase (GGDEF)-like protein/PAS domain S-box-containing protein
LPVAADDERDDHDPAGASDALFRNVFANAPLPQCTVSADATFMHINPAGCRLVGYDETELVGHGLALVIHEDSLSGAMDAFLSVLGGEQESVNVEVTLRRKDGSAVEAEIYAAAVRDDHDEVQYFVAIAHDVTERRRAEREYRHLAAHDALTELPNRAWFTQRLDQAIGRARRSGSLVGLYFVDLDGFKPINDRFGHDAGDQVLYTLAGRLDRVVRPGDTVARYGGDEFTILCEDLPGEEQAAEIATRILETVGRKLRISDAEVQLTASVGVVLAGSDAVTPADLISAADAAMYEAKQAGKATFRLTRLP